ncbi:peptidoglycan recognition protein family protein [Paenibacillus antibioticophila]|uniref:peptidoglycan recognition protein family protein n=1 Tax=Paenibacillus antibioticophila TaxID=1274374 RepID=UPI0008FF01F5|nr:N-acetylmuramoyl-L-alanine amidase [Paenibacillus antibioticophila]
MHHTWKPNYTTRKNQDPFECLEGMRRSHLASGWAATGQHFSVLENGLIGVSLDRKLNNATAGIKGANGNAICVEIIANFGYRWRFRRAETLCNACICMPSKAYCSDMLYLTPFVFVNR